MVLTMEKLPKFFQQVRIIFLKKDQVELSISREYLKEDDEATVALKGYLELVMYRHPSLSSGVRFQESTADNETLLL